MGKLRHWRAAFLFLSFAGFAILFAFGVYAVSPPDIKVEIAYDNENCVLPFQGPPIPNGGASVSEVVHYNEDSGYYAGSTLNLQGNPEWIFRVDDAGEGYHSVLLSGQDFVSTSFDFALNASSVVDGTPFGAFPDIPVFFRWVDDATGPQQIRCGNANVQIIDACEDGVVDPGERCEENTPPEIEVKLIPDYWEMLNITDSSNHYAFTDGQFYTYNDVFEDNDLRCIFNATDDADTQLIVYYNITIIPSANGNINRNLRRSGFEACMDGQECFTEIDVDDIYPSDRIKCEAYAVDISGAESSVAYDSVEMPSFDIYFAKDGCTMANTAEGADIIAKKRMVARARPLFYSNLIDKLDKNTGIDAELKGIYSSGGAYDETRQRVIEYPNEVWADFGGNGKIMDFLKNEPERKFDSNLFAFDYLRKMKDAEDSTNFLDFNINQSASILCKSIIDPGDLIKEDNEKNNRFQSKYVNVREQKQKYKIILVVVLGKNSPRFTVDDLAHSINTMKKNYAFLLATSPLVYEKTPILAPMMRYYDYDYARIRDLSEERYRKNVQLNIVKDLDNLREMYGADLAVGIIVDRLLLLNDRGVSFSNLLGNYWKAILLRQDADKTTLSHEFGHVIGGFGEDYTKTHFGFAAKEQGWCFEQVTNLQGYSICQESAAEPYSNGEGARVNIWKESNPSIGGLTINFDDNPEFHAQSRYYTDIVLQRRVGFKNGRFFDIMGNGLFAWIGKDKYQGLLNALGGYFA